MKAIQFEIEPVRKLPPTFNYAVFRLEPTMEMDCGPGLNHAALRPRYIQTRPSARIAKPPASEAGSFLLG